MGSQRTTPDGRGIRIDAQLINDLRRGINRAQSVDGGRDLLVQQGHAGTTITGVPRADGWSPPSRAMRALNTGEDVLPPYSIAEVVGLAETTKDAIADGWTLSVRVPTARARELVIVVNAMAPGDAGVVYIGGLCQVRIVRHWDAEVLDHMRHTAGETYAVADVAGPWRIVWEERQDGSLIVDAAGETHRAIVEYVGWRAQLYECSGTAPADGEPVLLSDGSSGQSPSSAGAVHDQFLVSVGGGVDDDNYGVVVDGWATVVVDAEVAIDADIGIEAGNAAFVAGQSGYRVVEYLGERGGRKYAVARPFRVTGGGDEYESECGRINDIAGCGILKGPPFNYEEGTYVDGPANPTNGLYDSYYRHEVDGWIGDPNDDMFRCVNMSWIVEIEDAVFGFDNPAEQADYEANPDDFIPPKVEIRLNVQDKSGAFTGWVSDEVYLTQDDGDSTWEYADYACISKQICSTSDDQREFRIEAYVTTEGTSPWDHIDFRWRWYFAVIGPCTEEGELDAP